MLEEFIKAVEENNVEKIKSFIHSKDFDVGWLKSPAIEPKIYNINMGGDDIQAVPFKSLLFYAVDHDLIEITKTMISHANINEHIVINTKDNTKKISLLNYVLHYNSKNNEIVDLLLSREDLSINFYERYADKIFKYIEDNKYVDFKNLAYPVIKVLFYEIKVDDLFYLFQDRNFRYDTIVYRVDEFINREVTALEIFQRQSTMSSNKILEIIKSLSNSDYLIQQAGSVCYVLEQKNYLELINEYFDLLKNSLNKHDSTGRLPLQQFLNGCSDHIKLSSLLNMHDEDNLPIFNINIKSTKGNSIIDSIFVSEDPELIKILRNHGSVEPKKMIVNSNNTIQKIIINDEKSPDMINGNKEKTVKIMELLYQKYQLTEQQIDQEITWLKTNKDYSSYFAEWRDQGIDTVLKVIDKLSSMTNEADRLPESWDFKKILGTIIYIVKNDQDLLTNLETTLSQLQMCSLSKLMNLLGVVQDKLIADDQNDYTKMSIDNFENVLELVLGTIKSLGEKGPLFFAEWLNDRLSEGNNKDPEKWSAATQKIQGIFNKTFAEHFKGVDIASHHFNDGLELKLIGELKEYLMPNSVKANGLDKENVVFEFIEFAETGATTLIDQYVNELINNNNLSIKNLTDAINKFGFNSKLQNGDFSKVSKYQIKNWVDKLNQKIVLNEYLSNPISDAVKQFLTAIESESIFNSETQEYISELMGSDTTN